MAMKAFVGGLSQRTTKESLDLYFSQFGLAHSHVMMDGATGRSRGFGFVNFEDQQTYETVLGMEHEVDGVRISVAPYGAQGGRGPGGGGGGALSAGLGQREHRHLSVEEGGKAVKVFVGGLAQTTTRESLNLYFSQFGKVDSIIMMDKHTGRSRGFGFLDFEEHEVAGAVLQIGQHEVDGVRVTCSQYQVPSGAGPGHGGHSGGGGADMSRQTLHGLRDLLAPHLQGALDPLLAGADSRQRRGGGADELKLFVGGLSQLTTKESLNQYFSRFGNVDSYVMLDSTTGRSRGFGFVNFTDEASKEAALKSPRHEVDGCIVTVSQYQGGRRDSGSADATLQQVTSALQALQGALQGQRQQRHAPAPHSQYMPPQHYGGDAAGGEWSWGQASDEMDCKVFVGGLAQRTTAVSLKKAFQHYSPVHCEVLQDKASGRSRGFGFVTFASPLDAQMVILSQHVIDGKAVELSECWSRDNAPRAAPRLNPRADVRRSYPY
mmetsp:Transcript_17351/g.40461  ORF Transcript_17351/g.40461 Transcript_17351/m.40461 type:complete len:491 (+) Transcript_17351:143-1615(+)